MVINGNDVGSFDGSEDINGFADGFRNCDGRREDDGTNSGLTVGCFVSCMQLVSCSDK